MSSKPMQYKRWRYVGFIVVIGSLMAVITLSLLWSNTYAAFRSGGAGNCGNFDAAVQAAQDGDVIAQMIPERDSGGAVITKDLRISGSWFPSVNCITNTQEFSTTLDFLKYGFLYQAPTTRTALSYDGSVLVLEDPGHPTYPNLDHLIIEHFELNSFGTPINGGGIDGILDGGADVLLDNILFEGSFVRDYGGGLYLELWGGSQLRIEDSWFDFNQADDYYGGGLYVELHEGSRLIIDNTLFTDNRANRGGGFEIHLYDNSELIIENSVFDNNSTALVTQSGGGGFIQLHGSGQVTIRQSEFSNSNTGQNGGGLYLLMQGGQVDIFDTVFDNNLADNQSSSKGGGLYAEMDGGTLNIHGSRFINNDAGQVTNPPGPGEGGGLYVSGNGNGPAYVTLANTTFENNFPDDYQFQQNGNGPLNVSILDEVIYLPAMLNQYDLNFQHAEILSITLDAEFNYVVEFETYNFEPALPGTHVHFFFDTVAPENAGVPGSGPWILYGGSSPFTAYNFADRPFEPDGAEKMCILVANADHSVRQNTGNCFKLP